MKKTLTLSVIFALAAVLSFSFKNSTDSEVYTSQYFAGMDKMKVNLARLTAEIQKADVTTEEGKEHLRQQIHLTRKTLKAADFWMRYLDPLAHKKINGPLPVEWETEVFEKFEKPYKREGAGLTLAELYLDEENIDKNTLASLVQQATDAMPTYYADSVTTHLQSYHHFYLCNRLFLLNLAAIYTTGFECPDPEQVIPELRNMMADVASIYGAFNASYPDNALSADYMSLYAEAVKFANAQPADNAQFDHFNFIQDYVNPLFTKNMELIVKYKVSSKSMIDYSLSKSATSIFKKTLYNGQNPKGIYLRVHDEEALAELDNLGKMLFYDPIVSGNNKRSCVSCHNPTQAFTDTTRATSFHFDHKSMLPRNSPTLINAQYNHLVMLDGKHITLQEQTKAVICNATELACEEKEMMKKVLSCKEYKDGFKKLLKYTPQEPEITFDHIASAITFYYSKYSKSYAPFDDAMNDNRPLSKAAQNGFNIFMSKAQCATCHFAPQFNGVKPPYIGSEFEVIGVPRDTGFKALSADKGRYEVNPAEETLNAFRTGTVRNAGQTAPYMHNGVFNTLEQVVDFYDAGGGAGRGLNVPNQTLSSDSLKLTKNEKSDLIVFIKSLNENIVLETAPAKLPKSKIKALNSRKVGGEY